MKMMEILSVGRSGLVRPSAAFYEEILKAAAWLVKAQTTKIHAKVETFRDGQGEPDWRSLVSLAEWYTIQQSRFTQENQF